MRGAHIFFLLMSIFGVFAFVFLAYFVEAFADSSGRIVLGIAILVVMVFVYYFATSNEEKLIRISKLTTVSEQIKSLFGK